MLMFCRHLLHPDGIRKGILVKKDEEYEKVHTPILRFHFNFSEKCLNGETAFMKTFRVCQFYEIEINAFSTIPLFRDKFFSCEMSIVIVENYVMDEDDFSAVQADDSLRSHGSRSVMITGQTRKTFHAKDFFNSSQDGDMSFNDFISPHLSSIFSASSFSFALS